MAENTVQTIRESLLRSGNSEEDVNKIMQGVAFAVQDPRTKLVNLGNTVFMVTVTRPGEVEVHTFSNESPQGLVNNFVNLTKYLKNIGVKKASTYSDDGRFRKIAEMTKLPVKISQTTKMVGNQMKPVYKYEMEM